MRLVECHDSFKGILAGMRGLSERVTCFSIGMSYFSCANGEKLAHTSFAYPGEVTIA